VLGVFPFSASSPFPDSTPFFQLVEAFASCNEEGVISKTQSGGEAEPSYSSPGSPLHWALFRKDRGLDLLFLRFFTFFSTQSAPIKCGSSPVPVLYPLPYGRGLHASSTPSPDRGRPYLTAASNGCGCCSPEPDASITRRRPLPPTIPPSLSRGF